MTIDEYGKDRHEQAIEELESVYPRSKELRYALDMAKTALRKQIPMQKRFNGLDTYLCPNCKEEMLSDEQYCQYCGQHTWVE